MRSYSSLALGIVFFPLVAHATETEMGFFVLGFMMCIPSFLAFAGCLYGLWALARRQKPYVLAIVALPIVWLPLGITLTRHGAPAPIWLVLQEHGSESVNFWPTIICAAFAYFFYILCRSTALDRPSSEPAQTDRGGDDAA